MSQIKDTLHVNPKRQYQIPDIGGIKSVLAVSVADA